MVILEPSFEQIEEERIVEETDAEVERTKTWWGKTREHVIVPRSVRTRVIEHRKIVTVPRSIWRVHSMFFGANVVFPDQRTMSGDLFSPDGPLQMSEKILAGCDVALCVENTSNQTMPFHAVIVGKRKLEDKSRA